MEGGVNRDVALEEVGESLWLGDDVGKMSSFPMVFVLRQGGPAR